MIRRLAKPEEVLSATIDGKKVYDVRYENGDVGVFKKEEAREAVLAQRRPILWERPKGEEWRF